MMPTITQTGLRRTRIICRWKISQMSRSSFTWIPSFLAQRAAGLGQEHVVEARRVQPGRRLVEEDDLRLVDDAERHVDAAALPAGVGLALAVGELGQLEALDGLCGQLARLRLADAVEPGLQYQFLARGHRVPRAAALGHVPDPPAYLTRAPP